TEALTVSVERPVCRGPSRVRFEASQSQELGDELSFELRCATGPIEDEAAWTLAVRAAGEPRPTGPTVASDLMTWEVPDLLPDRTRYCALRGYDRTGAYTPLGVSHDLSSAPFSQRGVALPEGLAPRAADGRLRVTALGDVNGDGF